MKNLFVGNISFKLRRPIGRLSFAKTPQDPELRPRNNVIDGSACYSFQTHFRFWRGASRALPVQAPFPAVSQMADGKTGDHGIEMFRQR